MTPETFALLPDAVKPLMSILLDARQHNDDGHTMECGIAIDEAIKELSNFSEVQP